MFFEFVHEESVVFRELKLAHLFPIELISVCVGNLLQDFERLGLQWSWFGLLVIRWLYLNSLYVSEIFIIHFEGIPSRVYYTNV